MSFNDDIKAAHPFYMDNMNNFTYCRAYAVHGNIKRFQYLTLFPYVYMKKKSSLHV